MPVDLAYDELGTGSPLVILHGLFGSKSNWRAIAQHLSARHRVVSVDMRNHGDSPHSATMNYTAMAEDVGELINKLGLNDVTLLGHSMGGKAAMALALEGSTPLSRLVIVDIAPRAYANDYGLILQAMANLNLTTVNRRSDADSALAQPIPDKTLRLFLLQNLVFDSNRKADWRINLDHLTTNIELLVGAVPVLPQAKFDAPSYVIRGAESDRVNEADIATMRDYFFDLELITIARAAHWPHSENRPDFLRALSRVLTK